MLTASGLECTSGELVKDECVMGKVGLRWVILLRGTGMEELLHRLSWIGMQTLVCLELQAQGCWLYPECKMQERDRHGRDGTSYDPDSCPIAVRQRCSDPPQGFYTGFCPP